MERQRKRFSITNEEWNVLSTLAENAKMDWFYDETFSRKTLSIGQISDVYCAFLKQNFWNLSDNDLLLCYEYFIRTNVIDDCGRNELLEYFKERQEND